MSKETHLFGIRAIIEAIESGKEIDQLFLQKGARGPLFQELMDLVKTHQVVYKVVPIEKLNRLTRKKPSRGLCLHFSHFFLQHRGCASKHL